MKTTETTIDIPLYAIRHKKIGGTESAIYNLVKALHSQGVSVRLFFANEEDLAPDFLEWIMTSGVFFAKRGPSGKGHRYRFVQEYYYEWFLAKRYPTLYPNYFLPLPCWKRRARFVVLYDIQYRTLPEFHSRLRRLFLDAYLPLMFRYATRVLTISFAELQLIRHHFGSTAAAKCDVLHLAIDWSRYDEKPTSENQTRVGAAYILLVSHPFPHKNLGTLLNAFERLAGTTNIELAIVGVWSNAYRLLLDKFCSPTTRDRVRFTGFVSDAELGQLYRGASALVLPSIYEGFGMPAVEAMGLGTPSVVSGISALREVTLGKAIYVQDPLDSVEWVRKISHVISSGYRLEKGVSEEIRATYLPKLIAIRALSVLWATETR